MKRSIFCASLVTLVLIALAFGAMAEPDASGFYYEKYSDHVEITGYNGDAKDLVIPDKFEELPVTVIGFYALGDCVFESVQIPNTVTTIGEEAFHNCQKLKSVTIPASVTTIVAAAA